LSGPVLERDTPVVLSNAIIHLHNELPLLVDLEYMPAGGDRLVRCTNVRGVDGKRPQFVHDRNGTFIFPMGMIRLIEVPAGAYEAHEPEFDAGPPPDAPLRLAAPRESSRASARTPKTGSDSALVPLAEQPDPPLGDFDEEPDEDLLARIRSV
jgi:hypothetical protein